MHLSNRRRWLAPLSLALVLAGPAFGSSSFTILAPDDYQPFTVATLLSPDGTLVVGYRFGESQYNGVNGVRWTRSGAWAEMPGPGVTDYDDRYFVQDDLSRTNELIYRQQDGYLSIQRASDGAGPPVEVPIPSSCLVDDSGRSRTGISADGTTIAAATSCGVVRWTETTGSVPITAGDPRDNIVTVSDDGQAVAGTLRGLDGGAFLWTATDGFHLLDISLSESEVISGDGSTIGGSALVSGALQGFVWDAVHGATMLPGSVVDISSDGSVVLLTTAPDAQAAEAGVWTRDGGLMLLGHRSRPIAMTPDGNFVVGRLLDAINGDDVFVWNLETGAMRTIESMLRDDLGMPVPFGGLGGPIGISDDGNTIAGGGSNIGPWVAVIPEPGTGVLVALGVAGLASRRARRS